MKIKEYKLVHGPDPKFVENDVNTLIANGFQPYGGVATATIEGGGTIYSQAMVKYRE